MTTMELYNMNKINEFQNEINERVGQMLRDRRNGIDSSRTIYGCLMVAEMLGDHYGKTTEELKEMVFQAYGFRVA